MLIVFKNGEYHYTNIGLKTRRRKNLSGRPCHIDITPNDIVESVKKMKDIADYGKYLNYFSSHLKPSVEGDIICYLDRKRQLMNTKYQVGYVTRLVLEKYYGYKESVNKFNFIY